MFGNVLTNYIHIRCSIQYRPKFARVEILIQREVESHLNKEVPGTFKVWLCPRFNEQDHDVKMKSSLQKSDRKFDRFSLDGFCSHRKSVFEAVGCFYHFSFCQELHPLPTEEDSQRGSDKRELDQTRRK